MSKNRKIERKEFDYLQNLPQYAVKGENKYKKMKFTLLDDVIATMEDDWYKLGKDTKKVVDELCFIAINRGYVYAKPETVGLKYGVAETTVYRVLKTMIKYGLLIKVSRKSKNHNGNGNGVYVFTKHPYCKHICEYLNLDAKAHDKAHDKAENAETPWESKPKSDNSALNLTLTSLLPKPNNNTSNHHNVSLEDVSRVADLSTAPIIVEPIDEEAHVYNQKWYEFVPKKINVQFKTTFKNRLLPLWRKIISAMKSVKLSNVTRDDVLRVGHDTLRYLVKHKNYAKMTLNEMCAYVYKGMRNGLYNMIGYATLAEMKIVDIDEAYYMNADGDMIRTSLSDLEMREEGYGVFKPTPLATKLHNMIMGEKSVVPYEKDWTLWDDDYRNEPVYEFKYTPSRNKIVIDDEVNSCLW